MRCPTCRTVIKEGSPQVPFCSERCRLIDLGGWLDGKYRIAGERNVDEVSTGESQQDEESDS